MDALLGVLFCLCAIIINTVVLAVSHFYVLRSIERLHAQSADTAQRLILLEHDNHQQGSRIEMLIKDLSALDERLFQHKLSSK